MVGAASDKTLDRVVIDRLTCTGCRRCLDSCPTDVLRMTEEAAPKAFAAYPDDCQMCNLCVNDCPVDAITINMSMRGRRYFSSIYDRLGVTIPDIRPEPLLAQTERTDR